MSTTPTFTPQLIGQTEKTLNAILDRELAGTDVTEPQWVALSLTVAAGGPDVPRDQFVERVADALRIGRRDAQGLLDALAVRGLIELGDTVTLTDSGQEFFRQTRATVTEITDRLWGDLPDEDLEAAGRLLTTVLSRARAELDGRSDRN